MYLDFLSFTNKEYKPYQYNTGDGMTNIDYDWSCDIDNLHGLWDLLNAFFKFYYQTKNKIYILNHKFYFTVNSSDQIEEE